MRPDPKFGWHVIWMVPAAVVIVTYEMIHEKITKVIRDARKSKSKEANRLRRLAGIKEVK